MRFGFAHPRKERFGSALTRAGGDLNSVGPACHHFRKASANFDQLVLRQYALRPRFFRFPSIVEYNT
jgi:hypothetical protein